MRRRIAIVLSALAVACNVPAPEPAPPKVVTPPPPTAVAPRRVLLTRACPPEAAIGIVAIAPDRGTIATSCSPYCRSNTGFQAVDVWDVGAGRLARRLDMRMTNVAGLAYGPRGSLAAVADPTTGMCDVRLWDTSTWALTAASELYCFQSLAYDPSGEHVVFAGCNGQTFSFDTATGAKVDRPEGQTHIAADCEIDIRITDDGARVILSDESGGLEVLRLATLARDAEGPGGRVVCHAFAPKKDRAAIVDDKGTLTVFDVAKPRPSTKLATDKHRACSAMAWTDASHLAVAREDGTLTVWDVDKKRMTQALRTGGPTVQKLAAQPSGALLASVDDRAITIWNVALGKIVKAIERLPAPGLGTYDDSRLLDPTWSPTGGYLATFADLTMILWDSESNGVERLALGPDATQAHRIVWSRNGNVLAFTDGAAELVGVADGARITLHVFERDGQRVGLVTTPDGRFDGPDDLYACAKTGVPSGFRQLGLLTRFFAGR
jgi:WD40 repeat protein